MLRKISKATTLPVILADIKTHCAIDDGTTEDARLTALIWAADSFIESETNRAYVDQTWELVCGGFLNGIELPKPPLVSVVSVKYFDSDNVEQTLSTNDYYVVIPETDYGYIEATNTFPTTFSRPDAVTIRFTCGNYLPDNYIHIIKLLVGSWNELREGENIGNTKTISLGVDRLLNQLKTGKYI